MDRLVTDRRTITNTGGPERERILETSYGSDGKEKRSKEEKDRMKLLFRQRRGRNMPVMDGDIKEYDDFDEEEEEEEEDEKKKNKKKKKKKNLVLSFSLPSLPLPASTSHHLWECISLHSD